MGKNFTLYIAMHWFQNEHLNLWISKKEMHDASIHHFESYKQVKYGVGVNWRPDWTIERTISIVVRAMFI